MTEYIQPALHTPSYPKHLLAEDKLIYLDVGNAV